MVEIQPIQKDLLEIEKQLLERQKTRTQKQDQALSVLDRIEKDFHDQQVKLSEAHSRIEALEMALQEIGVSISAILSKVKDQSDSSGTVLERLSGLNESLQTPVSKTPGLGPCAKASSREAKGAAGVDVPWREPLAVKPGAPAVSIVPASAPPASAATNPSPSSAANQPTSHSTQPSSADIDDLLSKHLLAPDEIRMLLGDEGADQKARESA